MSGQQKIGSEVLIQTIGELYLECRIKDATIAELQRQLAEAKKQLEQPGETVRANGAKAEPVP